MPLNETNLAPIRKLVVVFVVAALGVLARVAGVDIGSDVVNEAAVALVAIVSGYLVPDPRVIG